MHLHMTDSPLEDGTAENLQGVLDQKRPRFCCTVDQVSLLVITTVDAGLINLVEVFLGTSRISWLQFLFLCFFLSQIYCNILNAVIRFILLKDDVQL